MSAELQGSSDGVSPDPVALIAAMLSEHRIQELWLASTPQVAEMIVRNWPEFSMLQLLGATANEAIKQKFSQSEGDGRFVLKTIAKYSNDSELKSLAGDDK